MSVERAEPGTPQWAELAAPHLARYLFAAERVAGRRVLDLGSGAGYGAAVLRSAGAATVLGVDADAAAVGRAQVETTASQARRAAVRALRTGLMVSNPLSMWAWRKWPCLRREERSWAALAGLAAPGIADFPIVPAAVAEVYGSAQFTVAICSQPVAAEVT